MTTAPDQFMIDCALRTAAHSPCRSKRGVALFDMRTGAFRGAGFNGPPGGACPGRAVCAGTCGQRSVHAEVRALREAATYMVHHGGGPWDLIHVELAAVGGVVACDGPSCPGCAAQILDVGFVGGVWLYEAVQGHSVYLNEHGETCAAPVGAPVSSWRRYSAQEFYDASMRGVRP